MTLINDNSNNNLFTFTICFIIKTIIGRLLNLNCSDNNNEKFLYSADIVHFRIGRTFNTLYTQIQYE